MKVTAHPLPTPSLTTGRASAKTPIVEVRGALPSGFEAATPGKQPCVFLDRDGVINTTAGFVNSPEDLDRQLMPESVEAIAKMSRQTAVKLVLVTNQGGVDAGKMSEETVCAILERLAQRVAEKGGRLDAIYYCPSDKNTVVPAGQADARKPGPGMFFKAAQDFGPAIDLADSFMVGDMPTDFAAAKAAHPAITTIGVQTGFASVDPKHPEGPAPDVLVKDLAAFADWFVAQYPRPEDDAPFKAGDWLAGGDAAAARVDEKD